MQAVAELHPTARGMPAAAGRFTVLQVAPPSVLLSTNPVGACVVTVIGLVPVAKHTADVGQSTPNNSPAEAGSDPGVHVAPPSAVVSTMPLRSVELRSTPTST